MRVTILGNNSALPAFGRHPTSQIVTMFSEVVLIDCGEGTQIQMQRYGVKWKRLRHIFISHMHGDHYFGLPGLINSMSLMGRTEPLHLYAPAPLEEILQQIFKVADTVLNYPFHFHPIPEGRSLLVDTNIFSVISFPVEHRITCHGFLIERKTNGRTILPEECIKYNVPQQLYNEIKTGADYIQPDGGIVANSLLTVDGPTPKKYAYCADTIYNESFLDLIAGVDGMYHESTYLHADADKAAMRFHTTSVQAATLAKKAGVKRLLLGHFSSKYKDLEPFAHEAAAIFPNVDITVEGEVYEL